MKIGISLYDNCLGYLEESDEGYVFYANVNEIIACKEKYPIEMMLFTLPEKMVTNLDVIPPMFREYLQGADRVDIVENAKINDGDSDFVKLYKIASLNPQSINFKIFTA